MKSFSTELSSAGHLLPSRGSEWQTQRKQDVCHLHGTNCKQDLQIPEVLDTGSTCETLEDPVKISRHEGMPHRKRENLVKKAEARVNPRSDRGRGAFRGQLFGISGAFLLPLLIY